jgi:anti-sigma-K factor RskA
MSQLLGDSELGALAAEYVLGTLGKDELAQAQGLLEIDEVFAAKVKFWERRLGELHLMVEPVEPEADIWERIKGKLADMTPSPAEEPVQSAEPAVPSGEEAAPPEFATADTAASAAPEVAANAETPAAIPAEATTSVAAPAPVVSARASQTAEPVAPLAAPPPAKPTPITAAAAPFPSAPRAPLVIGDEREAAVRRGLRRWRAFSILMLLAAIALGALVAAWRFAPERVPAMLQPLAALRAIGIEVAPVPPRTPAEPVPPPLPPGSGYLE